LEIKPLIQKEVAENSPQLIAKNLIEILAD
jgi:hypothetical protein